MSEDPQEIAALRARAEKAEAERDNWKQCVLDEIAENRAIFELLGIQAEIESGSEHSSAVVRRAIEVRMAELDKLRADLVASEERAMRAEQHAALFRSSAGGNATRAEAREQDIAAVYRAVQLAHDYDPRLRLEDQVALIVQDRLRLAIELMELGSRAGLPLGHPFRNTPAGSGLCGDMVLPDRCIFPIQNEEVPPLYRLCGQPSAAHEAKPRGQAMSARDCGTCGRPLATDELVEHGDGDGCECAACSAHCWSEFGVRCEPADFKAERDSLLADLEAALIVMRAAGVSMYQERSAVGDHVWSALERIKPLLEREP
jgi:hypothetical protein